MLDFSDYCECILQSSLAACEKVDLSLYTKFHQDVAQLTL